jgi:hypothetical protein
MFTAAFIYIVRKLRLKAAALIFLVGLCLQLPLVLAQQATSTSFVTRDTSLGGLGGTSTSTSFKADQAGGGIISGQSSSTNFVIESGPMAFDAFTPQSSDWRWFGDENNETPVTPLAAENIAPSNIADDDVVKLRILVKEIAGIGSENVKFRLQFAETSDFATGGKNVSEIGSCTIASEWCYADGGGVDSVVVSTTTLTQASPCNSGGCGTHNESGVSTSTFSHEANKSTEYEFTIKHSGAKVGATYFFRAYYPGNESGVPLTGTSTYPSVITAGARLTFSISGLESGTSTEGIVTDVATTPTSVPFGTLTINGDKKAAQRLTVTTNAAQGYQIFVLEDQAFLNQRNEMISPVAAPNESPAGWSTACSSTLPGCYGYHAGDDTLAGSSVRFAPNDSYAKFETTAKEVAFSSIPVTDRTTDIVFRTLARTNQPEGTYQNSIAYILVAVY